MTHHGASGQRVTAHRTSSADGDRRPYRPEIDGLRAVAVFAVILNHVDARILPSGYLGVDIFFVISGYVITLSLFGKGANDSLGNFLRNFYERRSKRLLPALACFCLVFSLAVGIFNPEPEAMIRTGASALLGVSNLYLLKSSTDYFSHASQPQPIHPYLVLGCRRTILPCVSFAGVVHGPEPRHQKKRHLFFDYRWPSLNLFIAFICFSLH